MVKTIGILVVLGILSVMYIGFNKKMTTTTLAEPNQNDSLTIYGFSAKKLNSNEEISLRNYAGKVLLIVNTASKCGLTPQYEELQALHEELNGEHFAILGFPSNDFMGQEPGSEEDIASFCKLNYGVEFDMFEKVHVKGKEKHPIYEFLTEKEKNGLLDSSVSWNFQKYLIGKNGRLVAIFQPKVSVNSEAVRKQIDALLND